MKALWKGIVVAESDATVVVDGNHYFPASAVNQALLAASDTHTTCSWKGVASYYDVVVDGQTNKDAAWFYPAPKTEAAAIAGHVAFWRGVTVVP